MSAVAYSLSQTKASTDYSSKDSAARPDLSNIEERRAVEVGDDVLETASSSGSEGRSADQQKLLRLICL